MSALLSAGEVAQRLADCIDFLVRELLPCARRAGSYWVVGNTAGDPGGSLYVHRAGSKLGRWADCASGQFGDALDLINCALYGDSDLRAAMNWAVAWLGIDGLGTGPIPPREARPVPHHLASDEVAIGAARSVWSSAQSIVGSLAERYLRVRAITIELPPTLRYSPALMHHPTETPLPTLIAAISGSDQKVTAVQRIYLRPDGSGKAAVVDPKLSLGRMRDGACRLAPAGRELGLAEGIETALSAQELYRIPTWAACGSRMDAIAIADDVERLVIFADRGAPGQRAAERAAIQYERAGRAVAIVYPPNPHKDFNDLARVDREERAA